MIRANLVANYSLLGFASLCSSECAAGAYPGSNLSLSFDLAAGSTFSIASLLYADDLRDGTIDFFNTAKVMGVTVSPGATLTSSSGALQPLAGGGFGYGPVAAAAPVPEPATWAMLILGFAAIGVGLRRRQRPLALA